MEKDIAKIPKNNDTDIVIRIDDFGGKRGLTIREFVKGERYTGFTKAGTRIPANMFHEFKKAINSVDEKELAEAPIAPANPEQQRPNQSSYNSNKPNNSYSKSNSYSNSSKQKEKPAAKKQEKQEDDGEDYGEFAM